MSPALRLRLLRWTLAAAAVGPLAVGLQATLAPRAFFDGFPLGAGWVAELPPYNAHLVTDVGAFELALGLLLAWAAVRPSPQLVVPAATVVAFASTLHLGFHVAHLDGWTVADAVLQLLALGSVLGLPLLAIVLSRGGARATGARADGGGPAG